MFETGCFKEQLTIWDLARQSVTVDFSGGTVVSDAGLLAVRRLDRQLGVLREAARRLPDPRAQKFVTHSTEQILTQRVYQILGGYFDGNDAQELRHDPLFQTLCDVSPQAIYHGFYVKRGDVPERPIGELKNGLAIDRLSSHRFLANAFTLQCHLLAYALVVLFREANEEVPEVATAEVATLRGQLFKVGAVVHLSVRRIWFHFSSTWPRRQLLMRICEAIDRFVAQLIPAETAGVPP